MAEVKSEGYSVFVGEGASESLRLFFELNSNYSQYFIIVDENTLRHCLPMMVQMNPELKDAEVLEIESGEENKTIEIVAQIWMAMSEHHADRKSLVINLGGGVIGDMGGFIASTYKRGVDFINIPTTLLSQVDASVGGKLGIDLGGLKNQVGVFNYPKGVFVFPEMLDSLPFEQLRSGFAEVLKHALIKDANYWEKVKSIDVRSAENWEDIIEHSVGIKNDVVKADPREAGERKLLNFGHTIGHAIETFHLENEKRTTLLHGESIAIGMICEAFLSYKKTGLSEESLEEIITVILNCFGKVELESGDVSSFVDLTAHDKKNVDAQISFSLLSEIGQSQWDVFCAPEEIIEAINFYQNLKG